ncbi:MAG: phosphoribosylanthranilate isomerase [Desulfobacteraceae bacterium]|jgi:phosphoribosylanthranilate isomerase|nr:phosphoribosylanthranilate isomerase [Desulfobacteraceae bacterium]
MTGSAPEGGRPQVKVCGLTRTDEAAACAAAGAAAIGLVFYPPSPRSVTRAQARQIALALPPPVVPTGVFVNESFDTIMDRVAYCRLRAIQLHGQEPPELAARLQAEGLIVLKALFMEREPTLSRAADYPGVALLVEHGGGRLPGGNARSWDWSSARSLGESHPLVIAGGLAPENVAAAVAGAWPDAVDVSSGVERSPGRKDLDRLAAFFRALESARLASAPRRRVF